MSDKKIAVEGITKSFVSNQGALPVIDGMSFSSVIVMRVQN